MEGGREGGGSRGEIDLGVGFPGREGGGGGREGGREGYHGQGSSLFFLSCCYTSIPFLPLPTHLFLPPFLPFLPPFLPPSLPLFLLVLLSG